MQIKKNNLKNLQIKNDLEIANVQLELENRKQQILSYQLDNQLKQLKLDNISSARAEEENKIKKQILSKNISENNVEISEMSHIIYGNIPTQIDET